MYPIWKELDQNGEETGVVHYYCSSACRRNTPLKLQQLCVVGEVSFQETAGKECETCSRKLVEPAAVIQLYADRPDSVGEQLQVAADYIRSRFKEAEQSQLWMSLANLLATASTDCETTCRIYNPRKAARVVALVCWLALSSIAHAVPIDVYLGPLGQSNAVGKFAPVPWRLVAPQQDYFRYWTDSGGNVGAGVKQLSPMYVYGGVFGAELSFGEMFDEKIAIIKVAKSGSPISEWSRDGVMYQQLQAEVAAGLADLVAQGLEPTIRGGMWVQAEYESGSAVLSASYEEKLTQLITDLRSDFGPDFRFVYNQLHASLPEKWPQLAWVNEIRAAQQAVAELPNVRMVNVDDLLLDERDGLHFSPAMQDELGHRFGRAMQSPGDVNYDGSIDGSDFMAWQQLDRSSPTLAAWQAALNQVSPVTPSSTFTVPEPDFLYGSVALALAAFLKPTSRK